MAQVRTYKQAKRVNQILWTSNAHILNKTMKLNHIVAVCSLHPVSKIRTTNFEK
jgi:hypothetical protein